MYYIIFTGILADEKSWLKVDDLEKAKQIARHHNEYLEEGEDPAIVIKAKEVSLD